MGGAAAAGLNKIKAETLTIQNQRQEALRGRSKLQEAVSTLKNQRKEVQSNLKQIYSGLEKINGAITQLKEHPAGADHPQVAEQLAKLKAQKEQMIGQISYLKNASKSISNRISEFSGKLSSLNENIEMMGSAIGARKAALQRLAGQASAQIGLNSNRELGRKKG